MAAKTLTTLQYAFKTYYTPEFIQDSIYEDNEVLEKFYSGRKPANSRLIYAPIRLRRAAGSTAAVTEGAAHPTAAEPTDYYCQETVKIVDTHKEVSQLVINLSKNKNYNYISALDDLNEDSASEHGDFMARVMFNGIGAYEGYIAQCSSASGTGTSTIVTMNTGTNMDQFYVGQLIDILQMSSGTANSVGLASAVVSSVAKSTRKVGVTASMGASGSVDTTYGVIPTGSYTTTTSHMPHGLPTLINNSNGPSSLHGVTIATYPEFISYVKDLSSTADVNLADFQEVIDEVELHSKGKINMILMSDILYRRIQYEIVEPQTYRAPEDGRMGTGPLHYRGRSKGPIPIYVCSYANPTDDIYFVDTSAIDTYHAAWMEWMEDDGKYISKVTGYRKYEASMGSEYQCVAYKRMRLGKIENCKLS